MKYPYIQNKKKKEGVCSVCQETKSIFVIEWRVDIFQGNCEFEDICPDCLNKREMKERQRQQAYEKKMKPIWEAQEKKRAEVEDTLMRRFAEEDIHVKELPNSQWLLNGVIDWWRTTGTAIHRKSRRQFSFDARNPEHIIKICNQLK